MNEFQQFAGVQAGQQLAPQGFFGSLLGAPLGGLIGRGIGGLFGNSQLGGQIGQMAGGVGGGFLPLSADPYQQLQQQGQLAPQGFLSQFGKPLGSAMSDSIPPRNVGLFGLPYGPYGGFVPLPFNPQPQQQLQGNQHAQAPQQGQQAQQGQQGQVAPQGWVGNALGQLGQPLGSLIGGLAGNQQLGSTIGGLASQLGAILPFSVDPYQLQQVAQQLAQQQAQQQVQQQGQQGQLAPQGWFGDILGQVGKPLGGFIGGLAGSQSLGNTIGGIASQLGGMLPFSADPYQQQQQALQQQQAIQQQQVQQHLAQLAQQVAQQVAQQQAQQQGQGGQLAPQGWFGNLIGQVGKPLGGFIGGLAGNQSLGNTIGGIASHLGGMLPFSADPYGAGQGFGQQFGQQLGQQLQPGQYPVYQAYGQQGGYGLQVPGQQPTLH